MSRLGARHRLAAALVAAIALAAPALVTLPVRADVDPCSATMSIGYIHPLIIYNAVDDRLFFLGNLDAGCPGDGIFDDSIQELHGSLTLPDGSVYTNNIEWNRFVPGEPDFNGLVVVPSERLKEVSILGRAIFTLWAGDGNRHWISATKIFNIRRAVNFEAFNVSPERAHKGSPLKVSGYLTRLVFYASGDVRYVPFAGMRVNVYYRRADWGQFHWSSSTSTTSTGHFAKTFIANYDACWKVKSPHTATYAGRWAYPGDCIDVQ